MIHTLYSSKGFNSLTKDKHPYTQSSGQHPGKISLSCRLSKFIQAIRHGVFNDYFSMAKDELHY